MARAGRHPQLGRRARSASHAACARGRCGRRRRARSGRARSRRRVRPQGDVGQVVVDQPARSPVIAAPATLPNQDQSPDSVAQSAAVNSGVVSAAVVSYSPWPRARPGRAQRRDAGVAHAANQSSPVGAERRQPGHADHRADPLGEQRPQARAWEPPPEWPMTANDRCRAHRRPGCASSAADADRPTGARRGSAVPGAVVGHPPDAEPVCRRRTAGAAVRRGSACRGARRPRAVRRPARVVHVQGPAVTHCQIDLVHHSWHVVIPPEGSASSRATSERHDGSRHRARKNPCRCGDR